MGICVWYLLDLPSQDQDSRPTELATPTKLYWRYAFSLSLGGLWAATYVPTLPLTWSCELCSVKKDQTLGLGLEGTNSQLKQFAG